MPKLYCEGDNVSGIYIRLKYSTIRPHVYICVKLNQYASKYTNFFSFTTTGIQNVTTNPLFVSHGGNDFVHCGNRTMPCRTVRYAVNSSKMGDEIYIDYARGSPYMECENQTHTACSIELRKSISLYGVNGKAEIRCNKGCVLFRIANTSVNTTKVKFFNLVISNSNTVVRLGKGTRSELVFQGMLVRDNLYAIYAKDSTECSTQIFNSSFENNLKWSGGIYVRSGNLSVHIASSTFKLIPVLFTNTAKNTTRWRKTEILIQNAMFDYGHKPRCTEIVAVRPFTAVFNVTITDSQFKNHASVCTGRRNNVPTLNIHDHNSDVRKITYIYLSNLLFENNYPRATLSVIVGFLDYTEIFATIRNSIFKNNSEALRISDRYFGYQNRAAKRPTITLENNTFAENRYEILNPSGAAAIYFTQSVKSRVSSCRFLDNKVGQNPNTGVVKVAKDARVTFKNTYFENRLARNQGNQFFTSGNQQVYFKEENTFNLVSLKERQSVFVRMSNALNNRIVMKKKFRIFCPHGYKLTPQRKCANKNNAYMCYYITVQCERCPTKTYTLDRGKFIFNKSNDIKCWPCPRGGNCDSGLVTAKPNFWG